MYKLTDNPDFIVRLADGAHIPRGHWMWTEYETWLAEGNSPEPAPVPTRAQFELAIRDGVYAWVDSVVRQNDFDNITTCLTYLNSTVPKFKADAEAALAFRDAVALKLIDLQRNPPAGVDTLEEVIALMPQPATFGWVPDPSPNVGPDNEEGPIEL